jgi:hypothetical protein
MALENCEATQFFFVLLQRVSHGGPRRPRRLQLRYNRFRDMEMGQCTCEFSSPCLYLIRASQRGSGNNEFYFSLEKFHPKNQSQNMYNNILSKISLICWKNLLNFKGKKKFEKILFHFNIVLVFQGLFFF